MEVVYDCPNTRWRCEDSTMPKRTRRIYLSHRSKDVKRMKEARSVADAAHAVQVSLGPVTVPWRNKLDNYWLHIPTTYSISMQAQVHLRAERCSPEQCTAKGLSLHPTQEPAPEQGSARRVQEQLLLLHVHQLQIDADQVRCSTHDLGVS